MFSIFKRKKSDHQTQAQVQIGEHRAEKKTAGNINVNKKRNRRKPANKKTTHPVQKQAQKNAPQLNRQAISSAALKTTKELQNAGYSAYLVGGCVRDALLNLTPKDFDVATDATPEQVCDVFNSGNNRQARIIGRRFKIVHVRYGREIVEVTTFRGDHSNDDHHHRSHSHQHESGRLLRDNVFGSMEEDAKRRDFSINALYCDPSDQCRVIDFVGGLDDIQNRKLTLIGEPEQRYAEDPVRMLRAVRFSAKLDMPMDAATVAAIAPLAERLADIPAARLFDEVLKLLQSGHGVATYNLLREHGLFQWLFPATAELLNHGDEAAETLIQTALTNTDERIRTGKPVTPAFLFAALIWPAVREQWRVKQEEGIPHVPALQQAAREVVQEQIQVVAMPKRFRFPMQEIWALQPRLLKRGSRRCLQLLELQRFRAAYDFMLLRIAANEIEPEHGEWWTEIQEVPNHEQSAWYMQKRDGDQKHNNSAADGSSKKRRRRRRRKPNTSPNGASNNTPQHDNAD